MTQLIAILTIPLIAFVSHLILGRGVIQGYVGLALGVSLLVLVSVAMGIFQFGWSSFTGDATSCAVKDFYGLSGGIACSPVPVAGSYALILYGLVNLVLSCFAPKDPHD